MTIYTLLEEWISKENYTTELSTAPILTAYPTEYAAMKEWESRKEWRNQLIGCEVRAAEDKRDITERGYIVRYYCYGYATRTGEAIIKTTIREHTIY